MWRRLSMVIALLLTLPSVVLAAHKKGHKPKSKQKKAVQVIRAGELPQPTAHTLRKGDGQLFIGTSSRWGVGRHTQFNTHFARWLLGPNAGVKYAFVEDKTQAVAVELSAKMDWVLFTQKTRLMPLYTWGGKRGNRFNAGLGWDYRRINYGRFQQTADSLTQRLVDMGLVEVEFVLGVVHRHGVPFYVGYDWTLDKKNVFQFWWENDLIAPAQGGPFEFQLGASWNHSWKQFRLASGLTVNHNQISDNQEAVASVVSSVTNRRLPSTLPLPYVRMWWMF